MIPKIVTIIMLMHDFSSNYSNQQQLLNENFEHTQHYESTLNE